MDLVQFSDTQLIEINEAVEIAEDLAGNHFKISTSEWKKMRYDIKTLAHLNPEEITHNAFAQVIKYSRFVDKVMPANQRYDFYLICLQDHKILEAIEREKELELLALGIYIVTHELVHVVRFFKFLKMFESNEREKEKEESTVHDATYKILKGINWPSMQFILESYAPLRRIDEVIL